MAPNLVFVNGGSCANPGGRIQPHRFLDHLRGVLEMLQSFKSPVESVGDLFVEALLNLGIKGEELTRPGQRGDNCLVPGLQECEHLIAKLRITYTRAGLFVTRVQYKGLSSTTLTSPLG